MDLHHHAGGQSFEVPTLAGNVQNGDMVEVVITVPPGGSVDARLESLSGGSVYWSESGTLPDGKYSLMVEVPSCDFTVEFALDGTLLDSEQGGTVCNSSEHLDAGVNDGGNTNSPPVYIGICHGTRSLTHPYVYLKITVNAQSGHRRHHSQDMFQANSLADCPLSAE